ncbi:RraA family protein [Breznakiella homolactica]|uniref:Putative 4-hydroxy-4-methyl-2-oxoglutarate aldolase n=1 Tax=Breznakiella homolactica TaxID=2798577 RepID=A0A7T8BBI8_9SPIR|nr:hypothetical protein [Breznakiella homolactica]QQO10085.1 hypothetical protein JFL75_03980 [Breznakiella homolactica]
MEAKAYDEILSLQKRWIRIRSANLYDTMDHMGYGDQCLDLTIKPIVPGARIAGVAVTVQGRRAPLTEEDLKKNPKLQPDFDDFQTIAHPGCVIVVDGGGEAFTGKFGEMTSWAFKQNGATGIVVDGYIRDYEGLVEIPDYTVCARGTSPIESNRRWIQADFNSIIGMPGTVTSSVRVAPGDWIIGDTDGVIVVPKEISMEVLAEAEKIEDAEEGMRRDMQKGMTFSDAFKKWGRA